MPTAMPPLDAWLHPAVQAALIGGGVAAFGWLVNGAQNRRRDARLRHERVADVQRALIAEIRANLAASDADDIAATGEEVAARIRSGGPRPLVPSYANDRVFQTILPEVHILPGEVIDSVVLYYRQLAVVAALASDLRALSDADAERSASMFEDYIALTLRSLEIGSKAFATLSRSLERSVEASRLSRRPWVRSGR